ncbi:putative alpha-ketoglutarate-dependent hypophosphite dioxygenase [Symbiodinium microadriaticum]|uniref:Putative alpha-ketoglutarate-dependent hypophosphite dioxygenase n=1 Tax=Symbiodinium microadriaticum TaxID=2951 RepID=A0A1Q9DSV7_SYMMI|nr:putative alpha-ketoglutarate-dependent hypophosphite dioxygenase [Symbiodinium microadriaticum]
MPCLGLGSARDYKVSLPAVEEDRRPDQTTLDDRWGVWEARSCDASVHVVRLHLAGEEVLSCFSTREDALAFQLEQLHSKLSWPRQVLDQLPERSRMWDHPEELEVLKQYAFRDVTLARKDSVEDPAEGHALTLPQLESYRDRGFLLGLQILDGEDLASARRDFDDMLAERTDRAPDDESRFRAAHTLSRPLHQVTLACLLWCLFVSLIPIYAKRVFDGGFGFGKFPYPCFAAHMQLAAASLLLGIVHLSQYTMSCTASTGSGQASWLLGPHLCFKLKYASPPGMAFGFKYAVTNVALSLVDNSTHVLLGATELLWVLALAVTINSERPGVLEVTAVLVSLAGNIIVALGLATGIDAPFWPLFLNLLAPFIGALCISTLRKGVAGLFDPGNRLGGTTSLVEFTVLKLAVASLAALVSAMVLESGLWSFQKNPDPWWKALAAYPVAGVATILASGVLTSVLHVTLAWLAWLTSAMAVGLLGEVKVLPQWSLNQIFGTKHVLSSSYLLGAGLGIAGALLYAAANLIAQTRGKLILNTSGFSFQPREDAKPPQSQSAEMYIASSPSASSRSGTESLTGVEALVQKMATSPRVLAIVQDILGPQFCCWSAHLFCKLPGDPTSQPWHQDAGFWPLSESRAVTLWIAFDDVDESNAAVHFIEGSHRFGRLPWKATNTTHHLLTQEIPDVELLGAQVPQRLHAGEASLHSDLTVHGSFGNHSDRRRAGLALRFVGCDATCLGAMLNGFQMNSACILPRGKHSDPRGHWKALKRRSGNERRRQRPSLDPCSPHAPRCRIVC